MITFAVLLLIAGLTLTVYGFIKVKKGEMARVLDEFSITENILVGKSFYWKNAGIAMNADNTLLLIVQKRKGKFKKQVMDIAELTHCKIVKKRAGGPASKTANRNIDAIILELSTKDTADISRIYFYDHKRHRLGDMKGLFQKAWHWQKRILQKMDAQSLVGNTDPVPNKIACNPS